PNISNPPSASDALILRTSAFTTPSKLTAAQWESQLRDQVGNQYKAHHGVIPATPFSDLSNQSVIIQAGATLYSVNKNAFRVDGDLFIDTSGKFLVIGAATFSDTLSIGVKIYADLSKVFAGTATTASVLFLMESPAQPNPPTNLPPTYTIYG